jgi:putative Ca2+/H+ antiporter (TMEM165/GDT1 family)
VQLLVVLTTFVAIFPAELPDKTMVASMVLSTRSHHPRAVWIGATAAFAVHVTIAVAFGRLLTELPETAVQLSITALFTIGGIVLLREGDEIETVEGAEEGTARSAWAVAGQAFVVVFVAEWGDLTQLATASLAASTGAPASVFLGALLALSTVAAIAVIAGRAVLRVVPVRLVRRIAAGVFFTLALVTLGELLLG